MYIEINLTLDTLSIIIMYLGEHHNKKCSGGGADSKHQHQQDQQPKPAKKQWTEHVWSE